MSAVRSLRKLGRAALLGPSPRHALPDAIEHVAKAHRAHHPGADLDILRRAYVLAEYSHRGQTRKSGEPYITHPLAVTLILAELGAETTTLTASLLHDTVEDTDVTLEQVRAEFGEEVGYLVDGVTKLEKVDYGAAAEPETFRKMLVATGNDVRVMSIKLADRLHNMRTLGVMRPEKQARIARVTRDVLIPLAERLGVQALKTELEDLVFAVLHPEEYARTRELIRDHNAGADPLAEIAESVRAVLREADIAAEVLIRPRHFLSVHRARAKRGELGPCDFGRLLILVAENADCYAVLGELHTCFTPMMSEFKDFIAVPKFNLYQSLHTAVADTAGRVAEVLVRTRRMHRVAEAGVIALGDPHRTSGAPHADPVGEAAAADDGRADPTRPGWLERLLEWQSHAPDPDTFWAELRDDLAQDREITVFCTDPGGPGRTAALHLPAGATCVDAAYARYGAAGHALVGARVDGRLAALGTVLRDGDSLQLLMAPEGTSGPSPQWLEHARTPTARIAIRTWLDACAEDGGPAEGERTEGTGGEARTAPPAATRASLHPPAAAAAASAAEPDAPGRAVQPRDRSAAVVGLPGALVRLARCCTPVPPDAVVGFAVRGGAVTVHRKGCPTVARMTAAGRETVTVRWQDSGAGCRVTLHAESLSRPHLLADLTEAIAAEGAAVVSAEVEPPREHRVRHTYTLWLEDAGELPRLMRAMREVPGVYDVVRATRTQP
ncbi:RelA/SpoT family protein [Streptomyces radiopugnans]|uniref:GTP pyrophosphokinase n=1 Tax=Streptomyces radiopugnans TaxID=403935 RepID=A0A1H9J1Y2_9ACTN|nr:HD domain-containing protein [Streptomyces radiopugnans]SEQ80874.1 GTP pyrophosphokinase [Streptomyces radiopugnans]